MINDKTGLWRWWLALPVLAAVAVGIESSFPEWTDTAGPSLARAMAFLTISVLSAVVLWRGWQAVSGRPRTMVLGVLVGLGAWFAAPTFPTRLHSLEITATGDRNPAASGQDVTVAGLSSSEDEQKLDAFQPSLGWQRKDGTWISPASQREARLTWRGDLRGPALLKLTVHPAGGLARVTWDGRQQVIDLYAPAARTLLVPLPVEGTTVSTLRRHAGACALWVVRVAGRGVLVGLFVIALFDRRARRLVIGAERPWWWDGVVSLVAASLVAPAAARVLAPPGDPRAIDALAAFGWSWLAIWALLTVVCGPAAGRHPTATRRAGGSDYAIDGRRVWVWAVLLATIGAGVLTSQLRPWATVQAARWARVQIGNDPAHAAGMQVVYDPSPEGRRPFFWHPLENTTVGIRVGIEPATWPKVVGIVADGRTLDPSALVARGVRPEPGGPRIVAGIETDKPAVALLTLPPPTRDLTVMFAGGSGTADVYWLDRKASVQLNGAEVSVRLTLPAASQGWVLLPPRRIATLGLEIPAGVRDLPLVRLEILAPSSDLPTLELRQWTPASGCTARVIDGVTVVSSPPTQPCQLAATLPHPINPPDYFRTALVGALLWFGLSVGLVGLAWVGSRIEYLRRLDSESDVSHVATGEDERWWRTCAWVSGVAVVVAVLYATCMPIDASLDSITYFDLGRTFMASPTLNGQNTFRTPGYPVFLAAVFSIFGENGRAVALIQQGLISALAPLTYWALTARGLAIPFAGLAGLLVAMSPALRACANLVWTESPFAAATIAALLVYTARGHTSRGLIVCGALAGAAALVRPNGVLVILVLGTWMGLSAWLSIRSDGRALLRVGGRVLLIIAGYLAICAPWHAHLALARYTTDTSQGSSGFVVWLGGVMQRWVDEDLPINLPHRAVWVGAPLWYFSGWSTVNQFHEVSRPTGHPGGIWLFVPPGRQYASERALSAEWFWESVAQGRRLHAQRARAHGIGVVRYFFSLQAPDGLTAPGDLYWTVKRWRDGKWGHQQPAPGSAEAGLHDMTRPLFAPPWTPVRRFFQWLVEESFRRWAWLSSAALAGMILALCKSQTAPLVTIGLFCVGQVLASALIGWAVDRYVVSTEPALYILAVVGVASAAALFTRQGPDGYTRR